MNTLQLAVKTCGTIPQELVFILTGIVLLIAVAIFMEKKYEKNDKT